MNYEEAFETAIRISNDPAALEAFLATLPDWRDQLSRDLRLAQSVGRELRQLTPGASATLRRQRELLEMVAWHAEQPSTSWMTRLPTVLLRPRLVACAALAAAVLVLAVVAGLPALSDGGANTAEAVVIEGSVAEIGEGGVTINTADSAELVRLSSDTVLTDGFGNTVQAAALSTGQTVVLKGSRSDDGVVANQVELKDRLFGTLTAISGDTIHLRTAQAEHTIAVTSSTEIEGPLRIGAYVEVRVLRVSDGSLRALEIEAEDSDDSGGSSGGSSVSPTAPAGSPAPANTPAAGSPEDDGGDDHEDLAEPEEHGDDDSSDGEHEEEHQEDGHDDEPEQGD